jgi:hypothetical protein
MDVELVPPEEAAGDPAPLWTLLRKGLTRCACGTTTPASSTGGDCARFAPGIRLARVGGVEVRRDASGAYARFRAGALLGRPVEVVTGDGTSHDDAPPLTLLCPRDVLDTSFDRLLRLRS